MNFLEVKNISKSFKNHQALTDVSLSIKQNSIFGLLGHNGAGKTTLIRILTRILFPDAGEVLLNGDALNASHIRKIGYLPEERGLYKKMRVKEQLLYLAQLKDMPKNEALTEIDKWLTRFDLTPNADTEIGGLSKGMQQKVQFIATVINKPNFIILDEPFSGFDPINAEIIKAEILNLKNEGATILYSTHRMESVDTICDDMAIINKSEKVLEGNIETLKNDLLENKYELQYQGELPQLASYELLSENKKTRTVTVKLNTNTNDFLTSILSAVEVQSFHQIKPTVEDLFFKYVR